MDSSRTLKEIIPGPIKAVLRPFQNLIMDKYHAELSYWKRRFKIENGVFDNSHYEEIMLGMANQSSQDFLRDKVVADFGCGPRGSLCWADQAGIRIGIDVLVDRYAEAFTDTLLAHDMVYLKSTERVIPLPSEFLDIMFTLNALDHVNYFSVMCNEILRVLKPGGLFIGSFNLEEPATPYEPQTLDEGKIRDSLLNNLTVLSYRISHKGPKGNLYAPFLSGESLTYTKGDEGFLWVIAQKE